MLFLQVTSDLLQCNKALLSPFMKKTLTLAMLTIVSTIILVGCGQTTKSPADTVIIPDAAMLQQQKDFDQAMIEQSKK